MTTAATPSHAELQSLWLHHRIDRRNAACAAALDERRFDEWPLFFTEVCRYKVQARENFDRGLPLALIALESRGMLMDRVHGATRTIYHAPYYTRHVLSPAQVLRIDADGAVHSQTHYSVFRTRPGDVSVVYNVGRYLDEWVEVAGELLLRSRICVYDSEMVLNSLIYPV